MSDYPEHDKVEAVADRSQIVGEFLDWLTARRYYIGQYIEVGAASRLVPVGKAVDGWLAEWLGVDLDAVEREKRAILAGIAADAAAPHPLPATTVAALVAALPGDPDAGQ